MAKKNLYTTAVGIDMQSKTSVPHLSIKGDSLRADEIVKLAKRYGVPIVNNPSLVKVLNSLDLDQEIPEEIYEAVAVLLSEIDIL